MKTLIIEDEELAILALKQDIKLYCQDLEIVGYASTIKEGIKKIKEKQPDLIFLDIQLSDGLSFEILKEFQNHNFKIIFTTAYSKYAIKAIKFGAFDYLLKPFNSKQLRDVVNRVQKTTLKEEQLKLETLLNNQNTERKKIALQTTEGISVFELKNILKCSADGSYTSVHFTNKKKLLFSKPLKEFEELLSHSGFIRIHHSHIINLNHVISFVNKDGGYIVMSDNSTLPVSHRKRKQLVEALKNFNL